MVQSGFYNIMVSCARDNGSASDNNPNYHDGDGHSERERTGTLEQLLVTPMHSWELLLSKILPYHRWLYSGYSLNYSWYVHIRDALFRKQDPFLHPDLVLCGCQPLARYNDFDIFTKPDAGSAAFDIFNTAECTAFGVCFSHRSYAQWFSLSWRVHTDNILHQAFTPDNTERRRV